MNDKNTIAHTDAHNTQFWGTLRAVRWCTVVSHRTCGSRLPRVCHPCHPCMRTCGWCLELSVFFLVSFVFYLVSPFFFQPFLMSTSAPNERSMSNPLCYSSLGSVVHIRLRHTPHRLWAQEGLEPHERWRARPRYHQWYLLPAHPGRHGFLPQRSRSRRQPACGIPCSCGRLEQGNLLEVRSNNDQFSCDIRNLKRAQNQFPLVTQPEMICQTGVVCSSKDRWRARKL